MYGGELKATGLGTQALLLQQLALEAQAPPGGAQVIGEQRGVPVVSRWQVSTLLQSPLQQSQEALHVIVASLQMSPSGLQPWGFRQMPRVAGGTMLQVTGVPDPPGRPALPQQSLSCVQTSPVAWQPLAG